jgi:hypothetical protein
MKLDKALYRQAYESLRQWQEAKDAERARESALLSPAEGWRRYVELVEFCWHLCPEQSPHERQEKLEALNRYYERVQKLEAWRQSRGKTS